MSRSIIPAQDDAFVAMRREAFSEQSLQGYNQVLDKIFSQMLTSHGSIHRDSYGVAKKFVMYICALATAEVIPSHCKPIPTFEGFLFLLLRFSTTPSLWIGVQALTIWRNLLLFPSTQERIVLPAQHLGTLLSMAVDRLVDFEDLLDAPEFSSYALFLKEDFDELEIGSNDLFKQFLMGVRQVLMEIVEGIIARECENGLKFIGDRLSHFLEVERLDQRDLDERGCTKKTSPAYVSACCVFRAVTAANVGVAMYLERFPGSEDEKVYHFNSKLIEEKRLWGDKEYLDDVGQVNRECRYFRSTDLGTTAWRLYRIMEVHQRST